AELACPVMHRDELAGQELELANVAGPVIETEGFDQLRVERAGVTRRIHVYEMGKQSWYLGDALPERWQPELEARAAHRQRFPEWIATLAALIVASEHEAHFLGVARAAGILLIRTEETLQAS